MSVGALLALGAAACGDDESRPAAAGGDAATTAQPTTTTASAVKAETGPNTPAPKPLPKRETVHLTMVTQVGQAFAAPLLADEMGEFDKENINIDLDIIPDNATAMALISQGKMDASLTGMGGVVFNTMKQRPDVRFVARAGGYDYKSGDKSGLWVRPQFFKSDGTLDPCKLKGKTLAVGGPAGFASDGGLSLKRELAKCDLTLKDVKASPLLPPDSIAAYKNGAIDGLLLFSPVWKQAEKEGYAKFATGFPSGSLVVVMGPSLRKQRPEVAKAFLRAIVRTQRTYLQGDYSKDPKVVAALAKAMKVPEEQVTSTEPPPFFPANPTVDDANVVPLQQLYIDQGVASYDSPTSVSDLVDPGPLQAVLNGG